MLKLKKLVAVPVCYFIFNACSGQSLKNQQVQGEDPAASQTTQQQPQQASNQQQNPYTQQAAVPKEIAGSFLTQCGMSSNSGYDVGCNLYQITTSGLSLYNANYQSVLEAGSMRINGISAPGGIYQKVYAIRNPGDLNYIRNNSPRMIVTGVSQNPITTTIMFNSAYDGCKNGQAVSSSLGNEFEQRLSDSGTFVHTPPRSNVIFQAPTLRLNNGSLFCYKSPVFKFIISESKAQLTRIMHKKSTNSQPQLIDQSTVSSVPCSPASDPNLVNLSAGNYKCYYYSVDSFDLEDRLQLEFDSSGASKSVEYFVSIMSQNYASALATKIPLFGLPIAEGIMNELTRISNFKSE